MLNKIVGYFRLFDEIENPEIVIEKIKKDSVVKGTNLWVLVFAIFIASLGLNINSTAVIIGAMLISPLMGPIMGIGLGIAINDLSLAKYAIKNFTFAIVVGLVTSFIYFSITPLNDAYSELLSRTTPTIYDVLIALFGGLAGITANSSKQKGNVVPGVAIATALMPPLCTAGYGLATFQLNFFFGALYLFTINTVFIALATFVTLKYLKYPLIHLKDEKADKRSLRFIYGIVLLTIVPSIYFGYVMIQQNKFTRNANLFIKSFSSFDGTYLLDKLVDPQKKNINLVYGGKGLSESDTKKMESQLEIFGLEDSKLNIKQGFSSLMDKKENERITFLTNMLSKKESTIKQQNHIIDSLSFSNSNSKEIFKEIKVLLPEVVALSINPFTVTSDSSKLNSKYVLLQIKRPLSKERIKKFEEWFKLRLDSKNIVVKQYF